MREWLFGIMAVHVFHFFLTCAIEIGFYTSDKDMPNLVHGYKLLHMPILAFMFVWFIIGNVFFFKDLSCGDFKEGWILAIVLLFLYYVVFIAVLVLIIVILVFYFTNKHQQLV